MAGKGKSRVRRTFKNIIMLFMYQWEKSNTGKVT
jgi:hypothetical protein